MTYIDAFLLVAAGVLLIGLLGQALFRRTGLPDAIWLILVGALIGPGFKLVVVGDLHRVEPLLGAITITVVLFHGGLGLPLEQLITHAWKASKLAILTFVASVAGVAGAILGLVRLGWLPPEWTWQFAVLAGLILGGSSSVVVMATLGFAKVEDEVAQPLNCESALTDVLVVVSTGVMVNLLVAGQVDATRPIIAVGQNFGVGIAVGTMVGLLLVLFIRPIVKSESAYVFLLAVMFILYAVVAELGGSSALAVLAAAVVLGNASWILRRLGFNLGEVRLELSPTSMKLSEFTLFIVKSIFFTFIGASLPANPTPLWVGALLAVVMLLVRWPAARLALADAKLTPAQHAVAWVSLPRGLAAGVMAVAPLAAGIPNAEILPEPIFAAIAASILIFAIGFTIARRSPAPRA